MRGLLIALVLVVLAIALGYAFISWERVVVPPPPPITDAAETLEQKNLGLAYVENLEYLPAIETLRGVSETVPDDAFGPRNLAIAANLALAAFDPNRDADKFATAAAAADEALQKLEQFEEEKAVALYLRGMRLSRLQEYDAAYASFLRAANTGDATDASERESAVYWFAAYETARDQQLPVDEQTRFSLLISALNTAPSNLFLLTEALPLAAEFSPDDVPRLIESAKQEVMALREGMVKRLGERGDPVALLEQAAAAVESGDKAIANRNLQLFSRIIRPDSRARSDQRLILPNLLEFAKLDFSPKFYEKYAAPVASPTSTVTFAAPETFDLNGGQPLEVLVVGDANIDGRPDLFASRFDGESKETTLTHIPIGEAAVALPSIELDGHFNRFQLVDLDNDFRTTPSAVNLAAGEAPCRTTDLDLVATGPDGVLVLRNEFDGEQVTWAAIEDEAFLDVRQVDQFTVVDAEADGDLDLMIATPDNVRLFLNRGDATFEPSDEALVGGDVLGPVQEMIAVDIDRDVDLDVVVLRDADPPVAYFENLRHGRYHLRMVDRSFGPGAKPTGLALLDADENGSWDLLVATESNAQLLRSVTPHPGRWSVTDVSEVPILGPIVPADFDNDGRVDLLTASGGIAQGLAAHPWMSLVPDPVAPASKSPHTGVARDVNADGLLDVVQVDGAAAKLALNSSSPTGGHLQLTLLAEQISAGQSDASGRVNSYGLGSTVEVRAADRTISRVVDSTTTHIGLGAATAADSVRLVWTNGIPGHVVQPDANQYLCEKQTLKGSCPYLYTWDGEKFAFVTDLLWAAPIGLQFADGVQAVPREWEHLAVPGELLKPKDGRYELRVTEELWEAAYFDHVRLTAVDHPAGTEIFTNEKVGPPTMAAERIYVVKDPRKLARATAVYADGSTRDLTDDLSAKDGHFGKPHRAKLRQGLVEQHQLELRFDPLTEDQAAGELTLLLTGWVRPTDTSINVALSHDHRLDGPLPPRLLAKNADGGWSVAREFMGFPGGKTKTIAVDVTGLLTADDPVLRIETSMEFSWDCVSLLPGPAQGPIETQVCQLVSAELHSRGFSARTPELNGGPELYDYESVSTDPAWPLMEGRFTRFGDVSGLLTKADNQLAVLGSGDEIKLTFIAPPPKPGWGRDFVFHSVGWDKDADLNTIYGDSSEPYPTLGIQNYPELYDFESRGDAAYQSRRFVPVR